MPETPISSRRKWLWRSVQAMLLAAVGYYVITSLHRGLTQVDWNAHIDWRMVVLAFATMFVHMLLVATAMRSTLVGVTRVPAWPVMLGVTWLSRLGKYIPGKVASVAGLAYLLSTRGVSGPLAAGMVLVNTCLVVLTGLMVAVPLLIWQPVREILPGAWLWVSLIMVACLTAIHPRVLVPLVNWLLKRLGRNALLIHPSLRGYLWPSVQMLGQWLFAGLTMWLLARGTTPIPLSTLWVCISAAALGVTAGFLALLAPGGLGVRESIFLLVLTPQIGAGPAAMVTVEMRLVYTLVEVGLALLSLWILKRSSPAAKPQQAAPAPTSDNME